MKIEKQNLYKEKIIMKMLGLVYRLDNTGDSNHRKNGEENFINQFTNLKHKTRPVIFDVGANIGNYSDFLVNNFEDEMRKTEGVGYRLHLFEPQKSCFSELKKKFDKNEAIYLNNFGLSKLSEIVTMYKNADKSDLASLYKRNLDFYNLQMNVEEKIELRRADEYIQSKNISHIDLLKVDVEGHEIETFNGFGTYLNSDFIDFIQFEYGGANLDSHTNLMDFYNLLELKGFKICKIMKNKLEYRKYNPRFENFVYQNYVAVSNSLFDSILSK